VRQRLRAYETKRHRLGPGDCAGPPPGVRSRQRSRREEGCGRSIGPRQQVSQAHLPHHRVHRRASRSPRQRLLDSGRAGRAARERVQRKAADKSVLRQGR
jgi:hypothetical protein